MTMRERASGNQVNGVPVRAAPVNGVVPDDAAALRADIERTRAALGDTVEALRAKVDVKARWNDQVAEWRRSVAERTPPWAARAGRMAREHRPVVAAAVAVALAGVVAARLRRGKR